MLFALVWYAVHHFDWAGPLVANSLRAVFGDDNVAKLEDLVYGAEDRVNRLLKKNEPPKAYWQVPGTASAGSSAAAAQRYGGAQRGARCRTTPPAQRARHFTPLTPALHSRSGRRRATANGWV